METKECHIAIEQLLNYLENPELHHAEAQTALRHIENCPHCNKKIGHLDQALAIDEEDELVCQTCQGLLPDYLLAESNGKAAESQWQIVARHLETCPHCADVYVTLSELNALAFGEKGQDPPHFPVPDLSFLRPEPPKIPWALDELGRVIINFSVEVAKFWRLSANQPSSFVPAMVKSSNKTPKTLCQLSIQKKGEDLDVTISAEETEADSLLCTIIVEVNIPERGGWPNLADTEVTINLHNKKLDTQLTDAFGKAVFKGISVDDVAHLTFTIHDFQ